MNVQYEIWEWIKTLPDWQSDLVRRLLGKPSVDAADLQGILNTILASHGFVEAARPASDPVPATMADIPSAPTTGVSARIVSLSQLEHVGAVEANQSLEFELNGITIVYGDNAAGKSSYAKVLKQACRAVDDAVTILPNIFADETATSKSGKAQIALQQNGEQLVMIREVNTPPIALLAPVSIFDSQCAHLYADEENTIAYVPSSLAIFEHLARAQTALRERVQSDIDTLEKGYPTFLELSQGTQVRKLLDTLSFGTDQQQIKDLASVGEVDEEQLRDLEKQHALVVALDPKKLADDLHRKASEAHDLVAKLNHIRETLSDEAVAKIKAADSQLVAAQTAAKIASSREFTREPVKGVGSEAWRVLWEAARVYSTEEGYPGIDFPAVDGADARCVLCQQPLGEEAGGRLRRFEEFVQKRAAQLLEAAKKEVELLLNTVEEAFAIDVKNLSIVSVLAAECPGFLADLTEFAVAAENRRSAIKMACRSHGWGDVVSLPTTPQEVVGGWITESKVEAVRREKLAAPGRQAKLTQEIAELKARSQLKARLDDVLAAIRGKVREQYLRMVQKSLATTGITTKLSEISAKVVTEGLRSRILAELKALRCDHIRVRIESRGVRGKTQVRMSPDARQEYRVSDVFSESEQKALALAFFLAEVSASDHDGGIILDDPVTSLDHRCRSYVARRLVEEASKRQVIVFTHEIGLLLELQERAGLDEVPAKVCTVRRAGDVVGLASSELPWVAQNVKGRTGFLRDRLQSLKKVEQSAGGDEYRLQVKLWYELLREAWERAVEERLLNGVVQRFSRDVQTKRLKGIALTQQLVNDVDAGMSACSAWVHDQAIGLNPSVPSVGDLDKELDRLVTFLEKCGGK